MHLPGTQQSTAVAAPKSSKSAQLPQPPLAYEAYRLPSQQLRGGPAAVAVATTCVGGQFDVVWASSPAEVREAQRLRYRVFVEEMRARPNLAEGATHGFDRDRFDPYCDHLLVRARSGAGRAGPVIGTYRVLPPAGARRAGGLYSDIEFDLAPLADLRANAVELGRACVHPAWRSGSVIMALWSALGQYMLSHELDTMLGCASVSLADGGNNARQLWQRLRTTHLAPDCWQVQPRNALRLDASDELGGIAGAPAASVSAAMPPLIKGYLRCGARLLGPPAFDAAFNTADLPMMMRLEDLAPRYRNHFLGS